jgi:hypothetical protein
VGKEGHVGWIAASSRPRENRMCYAKPARVDGRNKVTIKRILAEQGQEAHHCYPWHYLVALQRFGCAQCCQLCMCVGGEDGAYSSMYSYISRTFNLSGSPFIEIGL